MGLVDVISKDTEAQLNTTLKDLSNTMIALQALIRKLTEILAEVKESGIVLKV